MVKLNIASSDKTTKRAPMHRLFWGFAFEVCTDMTLIEMNTFEQFSYNVITAIKPVYNCGRHLSASIPAQLYQTLH